LLAAFNHVILNGLTEQGDPLVGSRTSHPPSACPFLSWERVRAAFSTVIWSA